MLIWIACFVAGTVVGLALGAFFAGASSQDDDLMTEDWDR